MCGRLPTCKPYEVHPRWERTGIERQVRELAQENRKVRRRNGTPVKHVERRSVYAIPQNVGRGKRSR